MRLAKSRSALLILNTRILPDVHTILIAKIANAYQSLLKRAASGQVTSSLSLPLLTSTACVEHLGSFKGNGTM
jgi:hypothetical protein